MAETNEVHDLVKRTTPSRFPAYTDRITDEEVEERENLALILQDANIALAEAQLAVETAKLRFSKYLMRIQTKYRLRDGSKIEPDGKLVRA